MPPDTPCPSAEALRRSLDPDDRMTLPERQRIEAHVDRCPLGCKQAIDVLLRVRAHLIDPGLLLLALSIPDQAEHPPGAAVIEVRHVMLADGTQLACRSERVVDVQKRRIRTQSRYERRERSRIVAREDETMIMTWYDEEQITTLLGDAGYRDVRIEAPATTGPNARHFAVSARASA